MCSAGRAEQSVGTRSMYIFVTGAVVKHIEADVKTGSQGLLVHLCCVGEEARSLTAGVKPRLWWANTLKVQCGGCAERG